MFLAFTYLLSEMFAHIMLPFYVGKIYGKPLLLHFICHTTELVWNGVSPLPFSRQHPSYDDWRYILSEQLCAGLCDAMFTVNTTLI